MKKLLSGQKMVSITLWQRMEKDVLEKRPVQVARIWYGFQYEISSGLTMEDKIAFPYGKKVKEGAKTEEGSMQDLYR